MRTVATAVVLFSLAGALSLWQASAASGLPEEAITLVTDVDGKAPVTTLLVTTASEIDRWAIHIDVPWLRVAPASGSGSQQLTLSVLLDVLQPGQHGASLSLCAPSARGDMRDTQSAELNRQKIGGICGTHRAPS